MDKKAAKELWRQIEIFAAYAFNKSHAASYGRITYETAYMKANYSVEYMTAMLTAESGDTDKISAIIHECDNMGIKVLPPDINECFGGFTVIEHEGANAIRFGFYTIKNFGEAIADAIIEERKRAGKFISLEGLLNRIRHKNFNKKSLEALIMAGALDSFGERGKLIYNLEALLEYNKGQKSMHSDQGSLFGEDTSHITLRECEPMSDDDRLTMEREILGVYVTGHPLDPFKERFAKSKHNIAMIHEGEIKPDQKIIIGGIIDIVKEITTKKGKKMAFITLTDFTGSIEAVVFPKTYESNRELVEADTVIAVQATVSERDGDLSVLINGIKKLEI
jgi:DNA polymerase-3 subunit alpha